MGATLLGAAQHEQERRTLALYVEAGCASCVAARELAERACSEFPRVDVQVIDLSVSSRRPPDRVVAVPAFLLDGELVSLGAPSWDRLGSLLADEPGGKAAS